MTILVNVLAIGTELQKAQEEKLDLAAMNNMILEYAH